MTNEEQIFRRALDTWGLDSQISMTMGECGELVAALNRYFTQNRGNINDVLEEIADVEIMLAQLRVVFDSATIDSIKQQKITRLDGILSGNISHPHA